MKSTDISIYIPGSWSDEGEVFTSIGIKSGYAFANGLLIEKGKTEDTAETFSLTIAKRSNDLLNVMEASGRHWITAERLAQLEGHTHVLELICPGGNHCTKAATKAGAGLIRAGGLAVRLESTGVTHSPEYWLGLAEKAKESSYYRAYVIFISSDNYHYSCGMKSFGLPDVEADTRIKGEDIHTLLDEFAWYLISQLPSMQNGHSFSLNEGSKVFQIHKLPCARYAADHPFHNPFGVIRLVEQRRSTSWLPFFR